MEASAADVGSSDCSTSVDMKTYSGGREYGAPHPPLSFYLPLPPSFPLFPAEWLLIEQGVGCVSTANNEVINRPRRRRAAARPESVLLKNPRRSACSLNTSLNTSSGWRHLRDGNFHRTSESAAQTQNTACQLTGNTEPDSCRRTTCCVWCRCISCSRMWCVFLMCFRSFLLPTRVCPLSQSERRLCRRLHRSFCRVCLLQISPHVLKERKSDATAATPPQLLARLQFWQEAGGLRLTAGG